jgi:hypothetical protein
MDKWKFGSIDGDAFVWRPGDAWVLRDGSWHRANSSEIGMDGRVLPEADWRARVDERTDKGLREFVANLNRNVLLDQLDDVVSNHLRAYGEPITRENWLRVATMGTDDPAEIEADLPDILR